MDVMESPAFGGAAVDDDIESPAMAAAVAALRDSSATESAAVAALARLLTAREAALTEKLTAGGSAIAAAPQDAAVRWYFANLVHAPPNWFQATVYFATRNLYWLGISESVEPYPQSSTALYAFFGNVIYSVSVAMVCEPSFMLGRLIDKPFGRSIGRPSAGSTAHRIHWAHS